MLLGAGSGKETGTGFQVVLRFGEKPSQRFGDKEKEESEQIKKSFPRDFRTHLPWEVYVILS